MEGEGKVQERKVKWREIQSSCSSMDRKIGSRNNTELFVWAVDYHRGSLILRR